MKQISYQDPKWLDICLTNLHSDGYCVVFEALTAATCTQLREAAYSVQSQIVEQIGNARLMRAGELGVLRLPMKYDPRFYGLLEHPGVLKVVDEFISPTAIMHLMNAFILPPTAEPTNVFQTRFHMDFRRVLNAYPCSLNTFFTLSDFRKENGATLLVPATHQQATAPTESYCKANAIVAECPAGSMLVFDSTLWHAAGSNQSQAARLSVNIQFTRSYFKQQLDYVRGVGEEKVASFPPRTQQLLGWNTRLPCSLEEYYVPHDQRLYRAGQG